MSKNAGLGAWAVILMWYCICLVMNVSMENEVNNVLVVVKYSNVDINE